MRLWSFRASFLCHGCSSNSKYRQHVVNDSLDLIQTSVSFVGSVPAPFRTVDVDNLPRYPVTPTIRCRVSRVEPKAARILPRVRWNAGQSDEYPGVLGSRGSAVRVECARCVGSCLSRGKSRVALIVSTACAVAVVTWTLLYFRPTIERFLEAG